MAKPSEKNDESQNLQPASGFKIVRLNGRKTNLQPANDPKKDDIRRKVTNNRSTPSGRSGGLPMSTDKATYDAIEEDPNVIPTDVLATWGILKDDVRQITIDCGSTICEQNTFKGIHNLESILTMAKLETLGLSCFEDSGTSGGFRCDFSATPLQDIGESAFAGCGIIGEVNLPFTLTTLGERAFVNNFRTTNIFVPGSVTEFGDAVFKNNKKVVEVTLDEGLEKVGDRAFQDCVALPSISAPASIQKIGSEAFEGCTALTSASFEGSPELEIGDEAFNECPNLTTLSFGAGVLNIGSSAFRNCKISSDFSLTEECESVGSRAFYKAIDGGSVSFPQTKSFALGIEAFANCNFGNFTFNLESATTIGEKCFYKSSVSSFATFKLGDERNFSIKSRAFANLALRGNEVKFRANFSPTRFDGSQHFFNVREFAADVGKKPYYSEVTVTIPDGSFYDDPWSYVYPDNFREKVVDIPHILRGGPLHFETEPITYQYQYYDEDLVVVVDGIPSTGNYTSDVLRDETVIIKLDLTVEPVSGGGYVPADQVGNPDYTPNMQLNINVDASDFNNSNVPNAWKVDSLQGGFLSEPLQYYENLTSHTTAYNAFGYPNTLDDNISYVFNDSLVYKTLWDKYFIRIGDSHYYSYMNADLFLDKTDFEGQIKIAAPV